MTRKKQVAASALVAVISGLAPESAASEGDSTIQVVLIRLEGKTVESAPVTMLLPGAEKPQDHYAIKVRDHLTQGATMFVPSKTFIALDSPGKTSIALSPGSRFRVNSASSHGEMYEILEGIVEFSVRHTFDFFNVEFDRYAALVRGTRFEIAVEPGRQVNVKLSEGRLHVERNAQIKVEEGTRTAEVSEFEILDPRRHPSLTHSLGQDDFLRRFGTFRDAEKYYRQQLTKALRQADFDLLQGARNDLGSILVTVGNAEDAKPVFELGAQAARSRNDKPWLARMLNNLGAAKLVTRDYPGAIANLEQALETNLVLYPSGIQKRIAHNYNNLGLAYRGLGDLRKAIEYFERALRTNQRIFTDGKSRAIAGNLGNLGSTFIQQGDEPRGFNHLDRAVRMLKDLYPDGAHPDLAKAYNELGIGYFRTGDYAKAMHYHRLALALRTELFPEQDHPALAESYFNYGMSLWEMDVRRSGLEMQNTALAMALRLYPSGLHPSIAASYRGLAKAWQDLGETGRSADYRRRADEVDVRLRGGQ